MGGQGIAGRAGCVPQGEFAGSRGLVPRPLRAMGPTAASVRRVYARPHDRPRMGTPSGLSPTAEPLAPFIAGSIYRHQGAVLVTMEMQADCEKDLQSDV